MANSTLKRIVSQCQERHPQIDPNIVRKIWMEGYSSGLKGPVTRKPKTTPDLTEDDMWANIER